MAKEYYKVKNQRIEFDTEKLTMTVTMHDSKFTVISVNTLSEPEFNSQYYRFKADIFSTIATQQSGISISAADAQRIENTPVGTTFEDFIEMKDTALSVLNAMVFTSGSAE
jgi:hypothetical protein